MSSTEEKLNRLMTTFGRGLERDVLQAVLEMHGGDVAATTAFLQADAGAYVDPYAGGGAATGETLPADYMKKPRNFSLAKVQRSQATTTEAQRLKNFFLAEGNSFMDHLEQQRANYNMYVSVLLLLLNAKVSIPSNNKARCLCAAWARKDFALADHLLSLQDVFQFPEVLRAIKVLDAPRKVRALEKKLQRLNAQGTAKSRTRGRIRNRINDAQQECAPGQTTSVSGALCHRVKQWLGTLPPEKLEFFALQMPKEPWQELADVVHPSPSHFSIQWFLSFVYGGDAPPDTLVRECSELTAENLQELVGKYNIPYSYLRTKVPGDLPLAVKVRVAEYEPLDAIVWYYEELGGSPEVDAVIGRRLDQGEEPHFSYGKFMERLLYFRMNHASFFHKLIPIAEKRLREIELPLEPPVVVLGDASYSMDVAIRTSTIIASLLAALCAAELRFFNVRSFPPEQTPRSVEDVLDVATNTKADGLTAPACTIREFLDRRQVVKSFVVVSDEIENEPDKGQFFAQLFYRYYTTVYPARLVFVSFLDNPREKGRMVRALESLGIEPLQFRLDSRRPDLTKVDTLLGLLSAESEHFSSRATELASLLAKGVPLPEVVQESSRMSFARTSGTAGDLDGEDGRDAAVVSTSADGDVVTSRGAGDECGVCMEAVCDTALIECGHVVCAGCAENVTTCPYCRGPVVRTLKIFKP